MQNLVNLLETCGLTWIDGKTLTVKFLWHDWISGHGVWILSIHSPNTFRSAWSEGLYGQKFATEASEGEFSCFLGHSRHEAKLKGNFLPRRSRGLKECPLFDRKCWSEAAADLKTFVKKSTIECRWQFFQKIFCFATIMCFKLRDREPDWHSKKFLLWIQN